MKDNVITWLKKDYHWLTCVIMLGGILLRMLYLTQYPAGVHQDEIYSGYEAFALLNEGVDSHGYVFPVYFISWGHGMNALYAYITMPFIKLLGLNVFAIRLPQAVIGCITLFVFYRLLKEIRDRETAIAGMFLLAINPWHIMLSRWGLEANIAPFFLLLGIYFLIRAFNGREKSYIGAFLSFGLSLYCYAIMWLFVPLLLFCLLVYGLYYKKVRISKYLVAGIAVLGVLALPLVLFFLINKGILPEIKTAWFSVPQMDSMRAGEVSFSDWKDNLKSLLYVLILQKDNMIHNSPSVGIYYYCSIPFIILGGAASVYQFVRNWMKKTFSAADVMAIWMVAALVVGCMVSQVNVNRINCIHLPVIYLGIYGCVILVRKLKKWLWVPISAVYLVCFGFFCTEYFSEGPADFYYGYEDAVIYAESVTDGDIGTVMVRYPLLLFHAQMLPSEYVGELGYVKNYDTVKQIGRYVLEPKAEDMQKTVVYVIPKNLEEAYLQEGYAVQFDNGHYVVISADGVY